MPPAIELSNIHKSFSRTSWRTVITRRQGARLDVLRGASFTVKRGEIVTLLGLNGAGKTTLIKILAGLVTPDKGAAKVQGFDTSTEDYKTRRCIGLVNTNSRSFYWRLTGRQNLSFFAALHNLSGRVRKKRIAELLDWLDLNQKADTPFMSYSSGQQQRLAICRAIIHKPAILLMDEPTNSLDPLAASKLRTFIRDKLVKKENKAILWCTHDLKEAKDLSDRIAILHQGQIIAQDSLKSIKRIIETDHEYILQLRTSGTRLPDFLSSMIITETKNGEIWEVKIKTANPSLHSIVKKLVQENIEIHSATPQETPLETIFENLTKENHSLC